MEFIQYTDMTIKEIKQAFQKSDAAVSMAIKRMLERNPEHPDWKYKDKNTNRVKIKAEGVMWLANNYFITPFEEVTAIDPEKIRLEEENKQIKKMLELLKEQYQEKLELELEKQALNLNSKQLLLERDINTLEIENKALKTQNSVLKDKLKDYKPFIFGLYRKKGR